MRLDPVDVAGRRIKVGDVVRVVGVPDLGSMGEKQRSESRPVFEYLLGKYKPVKGFNQFGLVELVFQIPAGHMSGWHSVAIEPNLLQVRRARERRRA